MFDLLFGWRKASKCKKLIKRVQCRLKLLKNKRGCIVKQLREDVAHLLNHGLDQSAFQRVERLILDESLVQVYDLLDQFCEFIINNLPYIRKHRDCPNDINEAASTLIFSSARFGELPELLPIRKLFGERYSQRFVTTALELLPGNLVNNQIKENLYMKKVPDDVKYRHLGEIAHTCIKNGPLLLEYKAALQKDQCLNMDLLSENQKFRNNFDHFGERSIDETETTSETLTKLPEEVAYLDDIEEFASPAIKDGNIQDQRFFMFRSFGAKNDYGIDQKTNLSQEMSLSRRASKRGSRRRSVSQGNRNVADIECAIYYGSSSDESEMSPGITRKTHKRDPNSELRCTKSGKMVKEDKLRAVTLPCERTKEGTLTDNINRRNSFPFGYSSCSHIHPKLPDYDELAAKFMELKRENLAKQKLSSLHD